MEILGFAAIAVLAWIIFLGINFTSFKSQLMNEFGRRGVPFETADEVFFRERVAINRYHQNGIPIDQIVDLYVVKDQPRGDTAASKKLSSNPDIERDQAEQEKSYAIVDLVSGTLIGQNILFSNRNGTLPARALDEWSLGYVAGTTDAFLQKNGFGLDRRGIFVMTLVFIEVFGKKKGPELFGYFMQLQKEKNQLVENGMMTGGRDVFDWMANKNELPLKWVSHVFYRDDE